MCNQLINEYSSYVCLGRVHRYRYRPWTGYISNNNTLVPKADCPRKEDDYRAVQSCPVLSVRRIYCQEAFIWMHSQILRMHWEHWYIVHLIVVGAIALYWSCWLFFLVQCISVCGSQFIYACIEAAQITSDGEMVSLLGPMTMVRCISDVECSK